MTSIVRGLYDFPDASGGLTSQGPLYIVSNNGARGYTKDSVRPELNGSGIWFVDEFQKDESNRKIFVAELDQDKRAWNSTGGLQANYRDLTWNSIYKEGVTHTNGDSTINLGSNNSDIFEIQCNLVTTFNVSNRNIFVRIKRTVLSFPIFTAYLGTQVFQVYQSDWNLAAFRWYVPVGVATTNIVIQAKGEIQQLGGARFEKDYCKLIITKV